MAIKTLANYEFKTTPFAHQLEALEKGLMKPYFAYFMEMGTGKTKVAIDNMGYLFECGLVEAALIVAPNSVYMNWSNVEIPLHLPDRIPRVIEVWVNINRMVGAGVPPMRSLGQFTSVENYGKLKILCINSEAFSRDKAVKMASLFLSEFKKSIMIVDESTSIKNLKAKRTKNIINVGKHAKYRRILSGMPISQGPLDFYSQCEFLEKGVLGYKSYITFSRRYSQTQRVNYGGRAFDKVVGYQNIDELQDKVASFSYRATKEDCLDLPPKVYTRLNVPMTLEQNRVYKQLKEDAVAAFEDGIVTTPQVITQLVKLHQICCGFIKTDEGEVIELENKRLETLLELLGRTTGKVIIWSRYLHNIHEIKAALDKEYGTEASCTLYGEVPAKRREELVREFQRPDSPLKYFISQTATGGFGITLTQARTVVYYSNDYNLEVRAQSEDRAHRSGQTGSVTYVDIVTPDSVDELIIKALSNKKQLVDEILNSGWRNLFSLL